MLDADAEQRQRSEAKRRRYLAEVRRAIQLNAPTKVPAISQEVAGLLKTANKSRVKADDLRRKDPKGNRSQIKFHETVAKRVERRAAEVRTKELDQRWLTGALAETSRLAIERGDEVEQETIQIATVMTDADGVRLVHRAGPHKGEPMLRHEKITRLAIASRSNGIEHAFQKGVLDGGQGWPRSDLMLQTGVDYGEAYEITEGLLSNAGGVGGGFGPKGPQLRIVEAGEKLHFMREKLSPRQRRVLDLVCGEKYRVRQTADIMKAGYPATVRALRAGLRQAMENWKRAKDRGEDGETADRVKRRSRMVLGVR